MRVKNLFLALLVTLLSFAYFMPANFVCASYGEEIMESHIFGSLRAYQDIKYSGATPRMSGQLFTASDNYTVSRVGVYLQRHGNPTGVWKIGIKETVANEPTGDFLSLAYITPSEISTSIDWYTYEFNPYSLLENGEVYALTIEPQSGAGDDSNYLQWGATFESEQPFTGNTIFDLTPNNGWDAVQQATQFDQFFYLYGYSTIAPPDMILFDANLEERVSGNFSAQVLLILDFEPLSDNVTTVADNVTLAMSINADLSNPVTMYSINNANPNYYNFTTQPPFDFSGELLPNTIYYYQATVEAQGLTFYSEIKSLYTELPWELSTKPSVSIIRIRNVSNDYSYGYGLEITAQVSENSTTDDIVNQGFEFSLSIVDGFPDVLEFPISHYNVNMYNGQFYQVFNFDNLAGYDGSTIYCRAWIETPHWGQINSKVVSYDWGDFTYTGGGGAEPIQEFSEIFKQAKSSLGMTGIMGSWAFMGLILLILALIFGIAIVTFPTPLGKTCIAIAWALTSASVVGGFLFTGELGVWTIVIAVGCVVLIGMIFVSRKLSGGGDLNG